jgi:hypothetical protein
VVARRLVKAADRLKVSSTRWIHPDFNTERLDSFPNTYFQQKLTDQLSKSLFFVIRSKCKQNSKPDSELEGSDLSAKF